MPFKKPLESSQCTHSASTSASPTTLPSDSTSNSDNLGTSSSSNSKGSQSSTNPEVSEDTDVSTCDNEMEVAWGALYPIKEELYHAYDLKGFGVHTFGRAPNCSYVFNKDKISKFYLNLSKVHFKIQRKLDAKSSTGYAVLLTDISSCGTFIDGRKVGQDKKVPLVSGNKISVAIASNKAFLFIDLLVDPEEIPPDFHKKYILESNVILGDGAYGIVKRGYLIENNENIAVKIIKKKLSGSIHTQDYAYEGNILRNKMHKNVVFLQDVFQTDNVVFLVLEYVGGGDLFEFIHKNGAIAEGTCKKLFNGLLQGLQFLHGNNIIHRDLKPENVLMTTSDINTCDLKITDFGLSRFVSEDSFMHTLVGTPNYIAPEILTLTHGYTGAVDLWSLGCILYIMLAGYPPFGECAAVPVEKQIKEGKFEFHHKSWSFVSANAKSLVKGLLTVSVKERIGIDGALKHDWFIIEDLEATPAKIRKVE